MSDPEPGGYAYWAQWWREPGYTGLPRVIELKNRLMNAHPHLMTVRKGVLATDIVYGDSYICVLLRVLGAEPGATLALIKAGYMVPDDKPGWWRWEGRQR